MPRFLFYVNENKDRKHITGHPETKGSCGHIFKQLTNKITKMEASITKLDENCIKIAKTQNSYWLIIWAVNYQSAKSNGSLQAIAQRLNTVITDCKHCS